MTRPPTHGTAGASLCVPVLAALAAAVLLASCATAGGEPSAASARSKIARFPHSAASADCFFQRAIDNFEVLNASNLLVFDGRRRVYHIEISPPSLELRHAYGIGFESATGRVCGNPGDRLVMRNGSMSRFPLSITNVYRLDEATQLAVRAHFGQATPQPPAPEDPDAGAIEELVTDVEETPGRTGEDSSAGAASEDSPVGAAGHDTAAGSVGEQQEN